MVDTRPHRRTTLIHRLAEPWRDPRVRPVALAGLASAWAVVSIGSLIRPGPSSSIIWFGAVVTSPQASSACNLLAWLAALVLVGSWIRLVVVVRERVVPVTTVGWVAAWWSTPFVIGPPLFSHDVFSYAAQGELVARGLDPYRVGPAALGRSSFLPPVSGLWRHTPAPYGPLWLRLTGVLATLAGHRPGVLVLLLHLLAAGCMAGIARLLVRLARGLGRDPSAALAIALCCPLVLMHLVSGAHNEAAMTVLLVGGLVLARERHPVLAIVAIAAAASVKMPAGLALVFVGWGAAGPTALIGQRIRSVAWTVLGGLASMAAIAAATGLGWGWVAALTTPGRVRPLESPFGAAALALASISHALGLGVTAAILSAGTLVGLAVGAALMATILRRSTERVPAVALGLALAVAMICGPALYPWYLAAPLVLVALTLRRWERNAALAVAGCFSLLTFPTGVGLLFGLGNPGEWVMPALSAAAVAWWWAQRRSVKVRDAAVSPGGHPTRSRR